VAASKRTWESDARRCVRASEVKVAEVDRRQPDSEKRGIVGCVKIANRRVPGDGSLARSNPWSRESEAPVRAVKWELRAKGRRRQDRVRKQHVTARETGLTCAGAQGLSREGTSDREIRLIFTEGRKQRSRQSRSERSVRKSKARCGRKGSDRGVRGTAQSGVHGRNTPCANLNRARRSESGVVKRQVHRSPGRECKLVDQGRGVSLEEMPVAHEARVLVVEAVESRSRSCAS